MAKGSIGAHRFSIMCATVVVVSVGWASQAFALDPPIDPAPVTTAVTPVVSSVTSTTSDPVNTITNTVSNTVSNTVPNPVDTVPNATSDPVDTVTNTVSNTASGVTDPVSNTVSGATDTVSNTAAGAAGTVSNTASGATGTVSNTASGAVGTASGAGGTLKTVNGATAAGTIVGVGTAQTSSTPQAGQLSAMAGWSPRLPGGASDVNQIGDEGHASCVAGVGTACQSMGGTGGSWTRSVADIIRKLLALTGMSALALFVLACCLTLAGAVALYKSRDRAELGSA